MAPASKLKQEKSGKNLQNILSMFKPNRYQWK